MPTPVIFAFDLELTPLISSFLELIRKLILDYQLYSRNELIADTSRRRGPT